MGELMLSNNRAFHSQKLLAYAALFFLLHVLILSQAKPCSAQESVARETISKDRWLLVLSGLPGDEEHEVSLTTAASQLAKFAPEVLRVPSKNVRILLGDVKMQSKWPKEMIETTFGNPPVVCTAESLASLISKLAPMLGEDSEVFVFVLGHGYLQGRMAQWNVSGPDIDQNQFADLLKGLPTKHKYLWLTHGCSGYWVKSLSAPGHVVMAATEASEELTGTEMAFALGAVLEGNAEHSSLTDIDEDGQISLLDLYLATCVEVHQRFVTGDWLATEHGQLDDNGDGRGSEIQEHYLPLDEKQPGSKEENLATQKRKRAIAKQFDGSLCSRIAIRVQ